MSNSGMVVSQPLQEAVRYRHWGIGSVKETGVQRCCVEVILESKRVGSRSKGQGFDPVSDL